MTINNNHVEVYPVISNYETVVEKCTKWRGLALLSTENLPSDCARPQADAGHAAV